MAAENDELSLDDIEDILSQPEPIPSKSRSKRDPFADRSIRGWLAAHQQFIDDAGNSVTCTVPLHDETRPRSKGAHVKIGDFWVCRICYLEELDKLVDE